MKSKNKVDLNAPYGGKLIDLRVAGSEREDLARRAGEGPTLQLSPRSLCDLELLAFGGFSPLDRFMGKADYDGVLNNMRLANGLIWSIPITLPVAKLDGLSEGREIALRNANNNLIAWMRVDEIFETDPHEEAAKGLGCSDEEHPTYREMLSWGKFRLSGPLKVLEMPQHFDFPELRRTPAEVRELLSHMGNPDVVAFQTRNPMHRAHEELTKRAAQESGANLLLNPVVGMTKPGDVDHYTRVRCYEHVLKEYPEQTTTLSLLNLAMRMAGPREAVWHAIVRKNFGCTHFIVGRDHAGPGNDSTGKPFYGPYDAQELVKQHEHELDMTLVPFQEMVYVEDRAQYVPANETRPGEKVLNISGTEFRRRLQEGLEIPDWFSYPDVVAELRKSYPPRHRQGFTVFFTGLSGAGKSTIANALLVKLLELGSRRVSLLDGDIVRKHLSSELGFSRQHRDLNIRRIGFVASEITRNGGVAICAPIAPYAATRREVRQLIEPLGGFLEVFVDTPLEVCEQRDRKGLYARARAGLVKEFTGISDPYEVPEHPEVRIDTENLTPDLAAHRILVKLESLGFIR
jgi:sulfate adenylyltransferase